MHSSELELAQLVETGNNYALADRGVLDLKRHESETCYIRETVELVFELLDRAPMGTVHRSLTSSSWVIFFELAPWVWL